MMVSQQRAADKSHELHACVEGLVQTVIQSAKNGVLLHELEGQILKEVLAMGGDLLQLLFDLVGEGDAGASVETPDGKRLKRSERPHKRGYRSIFGEFEVCRYVYARRKGQTAEFIPVDAHLALPKSKFSYLLEDWDQRLAMEEPFDQTAKTIQKILGLRQHVDSLERMNRGMSADVPGYHSKQQAPPAEEEGAILVQTADGKGVPIRCAADTPPIHDHQRKSGPKPDRKKNAVLGAVYSIDPFMRKPEDVVASLFRKGRAPDDRPRRPRPCHKRMRACLNHKDHQGDPINGRAAVFGWMADEVAARNPGDHKPVVAVMDGEERLWEEREVFAPPEDDRVIEILDLLHVTPRLWDAAHRFHRRGSSRAVHFVRQRVRDVLEGKVSSVVRGLRRMATLHNLGPKQRETIERICTYFEKNQDRMRYNEYLARGFPIASGVIEGACRHVVKDRLERTGATWTIAGAQAMLELRCIYLSDDWDSFVEFHIAHRIEQNHPYRKLTKHLDWRVAA